MPVHVMNGHVLYNIWSSDVIYFSPAPNSLIPNRHFSTSFISHAILSTLPCSRYFFFPLMTSTRCILFFPVSSNLPFFLRWRHASIGSSWLSSIILTKKKWQKKLKYINWRLDGHKLRKLFEWIHFDNYYPAGNFPCYLKIKTNMRLFEL